VKHDKYDIEVIAFFMNIKFSWSEKMRCLYDFVNGKDEVHWKKW